MKSILDNLHDALGVIKTTQNAAAIGGAITGMSIVATVGYAGLSEYLPKFVALLLTTGAVIMVLFVVDYGLRKTLPLGFDLLISGQWFRDWRTGAFLALLLSFNFIQAFSSIKLSWEGRKEAVAAIQQAPELDDVVQLKRQVDQTGSAKIRAMDSEVEKLRKDIARKEQEIKKMYPSYVEKIDAGQDKWAWYADQLSAKKESKELDALENQLTALLSARTKAIEAETETAKRTIANIASTNTAKWGEYEISKTRNMQYIGYFGAGCTFILIITSLMLSLLGQSNVTEIEQKNIISPIRRTDTATPPHVAPAVAKTDDFSTQRAIEQLRAETLRIKAQQEAQREETKRRNATTATTQRNEKKERNEKPATPEKPVTNGVAANLDDAVLVEAQLQKARNNLRAYESKQRRNEGNPETLRKGVAKWTKVIKELEAQLLDIA
jgi:hypothetical protein